MFTILSKCFLVLEQEWAKEYALPGKEKFDTMDAKRIRHIFNRWHTFVKHTKTESSGSKTETVFATIRNNNSEGITTITIQEPELIITIDWKKNTISSRDWWHMDKPVLDEKGCRDLLKKCIYGTAEHKPSLEEGELSPTTNSNCDCGVTDERKKLKTINRNSWKARIVPKQDLIIKPLKQDIPKSEKIIRA